MNFTPSSLEPGNPILGVFAYLDATLAPELILEAAAHDLENTQNYWPYKSLRRDLGEILQEAFRLQNIHSPLRDLRQDPSVLRRNSRGLEIQRWLEANPSATRWVAIDDDRMAIEEVLDNDRCVFTDPTRRLTMDQVRDVIRKLG